MRASGHLRADQPLPYPGDQFGPPGKMPVTPRKRHLGAEHRQVLLLLRGIPFDATDAAVSANGITRETLLSLIRAGLVTTQREVKAGGQTLGRVRIAEAGRRVLDGY
jgi:hypothetical protein